MSKTLNDLVPLIFTVVAVSVCVALRRYMDRRDATKKRKDPTKPDAT